MGTELVERLRRWERAGGTWRVASRTADGTIAIELQTCHGELMERFTSADPELAAYVDAG